MYYSLSGMFHQFTRYLLKNQIILGLFLVSLGWLIIYLREIMVSLFLAYIVMSAVLPVVDALRARHWQKILAVLVPYLLIIIAIFLLVIPLVPFVISQIQ